jgi:hypothetical protein
MGKEDGDSIDDDLEEELDLKGPECDCMGGLVVVSRCFLMDMEVRTNTEEEGKAG